MNQFNFWTNFIIFILFFFEYLMRELILKFNIQIFTLVLYFHYFQYKFRSLSICFCLNCELTLNICCFFLKNSAHFSKWSNVFNKISFALAVYGLYEHSLNYLMNCFDQLVVGQFSFYLSNVC